MPPRAVERYLMINSCLIACVPIFSLLGNVFCQILSFRKLPGLGLLNSICLGFAAGFCCLFILDFFYPRGSLNPPEVLLIHSLTYVSLGYCYFHFVNLGETARRIRILWEIKDSQGGLSLEEILMRYNAQEILQRRISRLVKNRQMVFKNDKYYI